MSQKNKIKQLLEKYNEVLLESMQVAVTEDLINLIIVNSDDTDFELREMINKKAEFKKYVFAEFLKQNSSSVIKELTKMDETRYRLPKRKNSIQN